MPRATHHHGRAFLHIDVGGWVCLLCGLAILAATLLAPAWVDLIHLKRENAELARLARGAQAWCENYNAFVDAVEKDDPMLLTRLAWKHLKLKPAESQVVFVSAIDEGDDSMDHWMRPEMPKPDDADAMSELPDTKLTRLLLGGSRPWVIAFGGGVLLVGLLVSPRTRRDETTTAELDPQPQIP